MGTPQFLLRRSSVAAKIPTTGQFAVGELALNTYDGKLYARCNNGADFVQLIGGATPGMLQTHSQFFGTAALSAVESYEYDNQVYLFTQGQAQSLTTWLHVPNAYLAGTQILFKFNAYSPDVVSTNKFKFQTVTTLIRSGTDAVTSTTNQYTSTTGDQSLNATVNCNLQVSLDLTNSSGQINSVAVSPGDLIKVVLSRVATTGTDSTVDVRFVPTTASFQFS